MDLLQYNSFYLVGIKGVAMTSLAQLLLDAGKSVAGSDVAEDFPTKELLNKFKIEIDTNFKTPLSEGVECVVYTGAHQGKHNPQVKWAEENGIPIISQAQALAFFFNQKQGIAVCGVGGKSTISAMITWIMTALQEQPSFSVGVGNIPGLDKTGAWTDSDYFVAEADEYVEDPTEVKEGVAIVPRFAYLKPVITVCPNLKFDHPDVYRDFTQTKQVFAQFFATTQDKLVVNVDDEELMKLAKESNKELVTYGESEQADFQLREYHAHDGHAHVIFSYQGNDYGFTLSIPGKFNALNALAAIATVTQVNNKALTDHQLDQFNSTARRFESRGEINGVQCYDDYAHHPHEVAAAIEALREWYPEAKKVVAFQSHTYSRTKELFAEFVDSFAGADEVVMTDIFSSAREEKDESVSSTILCEAIQKKHGIKAKNVENNEQLAEYFKTELKPGDVFLTLGAGDIYEVYELLKS